VATATEWSISVPLGNTGSSRCAPDRPSVILNVLLAYGTGSNAMIIIVEIVSRSGTRACKEYDVPTFGSAIAAAERELRGYSNFRFVDVRIKDECAEASEEDWCI
jgi:hypothetical protein